LDDVALDRRAIDMVGSVNVCCVSLSVGMVTLKLSKVATTEKIYEKSMEKNERQFWSQKNSSINQAIKEGPRDLKNCLQRALSCSK
jgi:hypothetical protein